MTNWHGGAAAWALAASLAGSGGTNHPSIVSP